MFLIQSQYDTWQVENILNIAGNKDDLVNTLGHNITHLARQIIGDIPFNKKEDHLAHILSRRSKNGLYLVSCAIHEFAPGQNIGGIGFGEALRQWLHNEKNLFYDIQRYPCNNCCP